MCGIAGIYDLGKGNRVEREDVARMVSELRHRGPNASEARVYGGVVGLGHARLSILDLNARANQPFESPDGRLSITYNGEIFNYVELRQELEGLGRQFRTTSDTEVVLQAYAQWGDEFVHRLNGMWSFAIYDTRSRRLFCSRDRFGIKPFAWAVARGRFIFASEIKAILKVAPELAQPNHRVIAEMLRSADGHRIEDTGFESIQRLEAAHNLVVTSDGIEKHRYWDYPTEIEDDVKLEDAAERVRDLLADAVRIRLRSDVPVGSCLSSGVDSSSIVSLVRSITSAPHHTFTARFRGDPFDEAERAGKLADSLSMTSTAVDLDPGDFIGDLARCIRHLESPERAPAVLPLFRIMETAQKSVTVMLDGQGADELFAGYPESCFPYALRDLMSREGVIPSIRELSRRFSSIGARSLLAELANAYVPSSKALSEALRGEDRVYTDAVTHEYGRSTALRDEAWRSGDSLNVLLRQQHGTRLARLLHYGDAISMAHSIEVRMPFMDYRLVEQVFRWPGHLKFRDGQSKMLLRRAMEGTVPQDILAQRRKLAFRTPISRWFRDDAERTLSPVLLSDACRRRGLLDPDGVERVIRRHQEGRADHSTALFRWVSCELWFQEFVDAA